MANAFLTMLDVAKLNGSDAVVGLIEENLNVSPEAMMFPARVITGTGFKTLHRTALPGSQFSLVNEGVSTTKSTYENKRVECAYLHQQMEIAKGAADTDEQGAEHVKALEADGHAQSAIMKVGAQVWYGKGAGGDAKGFPGAQEVVDSAYVLDATGSTANTGSTVYGVRLGEKFASMVFGQNSVMSVGDWREQRITRTVNGVAGELDAYLNSLTSWVGCQWVNKDALAAIKNLTAQTGKGLTDALVAQLLSQLKWVPDHLFMTRRSRYQLQLSRTPVAGTVTAGNLAMAPLPTESNGIPIVITDNLTNTEAIR